MSEQITLDYLSKLLNKKITRQMEISLSSAQKSRVYSWLKKNCIVINESALTRKFTVAELLSGGRIGQPLQFTQVKHSDYNQLNNDSLQIGIDIQRIDELFPKELPFDLKADLELTQIFTLRELSYAQSKADPEVTLTGIFCAKEAIKKASNASQKLKEIEVIPDEDGRPSTSGLVLSISHSGNYAIGIAINQTLTQAKATDLNRIIERHELEAAPGNRPPSIWYKGIRIIDILFSFLLIIVFIFLYHLNKIYV